MVVDLIGWEDGPYGEITLMDLFRIWYHDIAFAQFIALLSRFQQVPDKAAIVDEESAVALRRTLSDLEMECQKINLSAVSDLIHYVLIPYDPDFIAKNNYSYPAYSNALSWLEAVDFMFKSQADRQIFIRLSPEDSTLYRNPDLFGAEVSAAFPSDASTFEITEAGRCLALGRHTASVFHLMRVLEKGLKALADSLPNVTFIIPFDYLNWQNVIEMIESEIKAMGKLPAGQVKTDQLKIYSEIAMQFRYFKDAWRNGVAHSRESYGPEQALSIFRHVGEFMRDIVRLGLKE